MINEKEKIKMNWKKWDEDTWVNMNEVGLLDVQCLYEDWHKQEPSIRAYCCRAVIFGQDYFREFSTKAEAVAFIEELIK